MGTQENTRTGDSPQTCVGEQLGGFQNLFCVNSWLVVVHLWGDYMDDSSCPASNGASSTVQPIHIFLLESNDTLVHILQNVILWGTSKKLNEGSGLLLKGDIVEWHVVCIEDRLGVNHICQKIYNTKLDTSTQWHAGTQEGRARTEFEPIPASCPLKMSMVWPLISQISNVNKNKHTTFNNSFFVDCRWTNVTV